MRFALTFVLTAILSASCGSSRPLAPSEKVNIINSFADDRTEVLITLSDHNPALIKEQRKVSLESGYQELRFIDVSDAIISESVVVKAINPKDDVFFIEQNYLMDLISPARIVEKSIGKKVRIYSIEEATGQEKMLEGALLYGPDGLILEHKDGIKIIDQGTRIEVDEIKNDLQPSPMLTWLVYSDRAGSAVIETSYLTSQFSWRAEYVVDLSPDARTADVTAYASLENQTMLSLKGAVLQLASSSEDTHLQPATRPLDIRPFQNKQIALFSAKGVAVSQSYVLLLNLGITETMNLPGYLRLDLDHSKKSRLNMPFPNGRAFIRSSDIKNESALYLGQTSVEGAPVGEPLRIELPGNVPVDGEWKPLNTQEISGYWYNSGELTLKNRLGRKVDIQIEIEMESNPGASIEIDGISAVKSNIYRWVYKITLVPKEQKTLTVKSRP